MLPSSGEGMEQQVHLLVANIEKALRRNATPAVFVEEVVKKFPSTTVGVLKFAPLDTIFEKLAEETPDDWEVNTIKGQMFIKDLFTALKK